MTRYLNVIQVLARLYNITLPTLDIYIYAYPKLEMLRYIPCLSLNKIKHIEVVLMLEQFDYTKEVI